MSGYLMLRLLRGCLAAQFNHILLCSLTAIQEEGIVLNAIETAKLLSESLETLLFSVPVNLERKSTIITRIQTTTAT